MTCIRKFEQGKIICDNVDFPGILEVVEMFIEKYELNFTKLSNTIGVIFKQ